MTYTLHREAEQDLEIAFLFYKDEASIAVALRFLDEFERLAELLDSNPGFGTPTNKDRRSYPFRTYPYSVIYKPTDAGIRILVVRHQRQEPRYGRERS